MRKFCAVQQEAGLFLRRYTAPSGDTVTSMLASEGSINDVRGLLAGHHTDPRRPTGCTVVLALQGAVCGVDVRGAAPGTRETELLAPLNLVEKVHAVLLAGGSAWGLDAAGGVMRWLEARGVGHRVGDNLVPIVPAAILYDLWVGDGSIRPDAAAGQAACEAAMAAAGSGVAAFAEGNVGAGAGATVGKLFGPQRAMKGGIGSASLRLGDVTVAAVVALNAVGDVIDPASGTVLAGARGDDGRSLPGITAAMLSGASLQRPTAGSSTTIAVVATDAVLTKAQAQKVAQMAHDGLARTIDPVHTMYDGDTVFAVGTGASGQAGDTTLIGVAAASVLARAVLRAVHQARGIGGGGVPDVPSLADLRR